MFEKLNLEIIVDFTFMNKLQDVETKFLIQRK